MAGWQAWVLMAGAGGLAAFLFLLKVRPRRVSVPSLLLWTQVLNDRRESTLWERIRRAVSLVATVAIAVALVLGLARPSRARAAAEVPSGRLAIVIDSSWSMLARTHTGETRWSHAIAEARRLAAASADGGVALVTTADGLVEGPTTDLALIDAALDRIVPAGGGGALPKVAGAETVYFITDGAIARPRTPGVVVRSVFESAANVGITAFEIRASAGGAAAGSAYLEVANFGPAQQVHVTIGRGTASLLDRRVDMAADEILRQVVPIDRGGDPGLHARVEARGNALAIDDEAVAWFDRSRPLSVLVVGDRTTWLARLFAGNPDVTATFVAPAAYGPTQADAIVFDRWAPPEPPARPSLFFAPPAKTSWLAGDDAVEQKPRWLTSGSHPVVRGVDPFTLIIERARAYRSTELLPIAASERGTPLVYVNKSVGRARLAVVTFGSLESNLASAPAFPVLVGNALAWLAGPMDGGTRRPGLASFDAAVARVSGPGGADVPLARLPGEAVGVLRVPGLYVAEGGGARTTFAVNAGDPAISNLTRSSAAAASEAIPARARAPRPWWLYCVALAFAAALIEWWTWLRRITV